MPFTAMADRCPVCDSRVNDKVPPADVEHEGTLYVFESAKCKELFKQDPGEYT